MSLSIHLSHSFYLLDEWTQDELQHSRAEGQRVDVVVSSLEEMLDFKRSLAEAEDGSGLLGLGVSVVGLNEWISDMWQLWGSAEHLISKKERTLLMLEIMRLQKDSLGDDALTITPGMLSTLCKAAQEFSLATGTTQNDALVHVYMQQSGEELSQGEALVMEYVKSYIELAKEKGMLEPQLALLKLSHRLEQAIKNKPKLLVLASGRLSSLQRLFVLALCQSYEVSLRISCGSGNAQDIAQHEIDVLQSACAALGVEILIDSDNDLAIEHKHMNGELKVLHSQLFKAKLEATLEPHGALKLIRPEGPYVRGRLLADSIAKLSLQSDTRVLVSCANTTDAWLSYAPYVREVVSRLEISFMMKSHDLPALSAFLDFAEGVWKLKLAQDAIERSAGMSDRALHKRKGLMDWWPPKQISNFLLSDISGVDAMVAYDLDARWRKDRKLTPQKVLRTLKSSKRSSEACAQATQAILAGKIAQAARMLAVSYQESHQDEGTHEQITLSTLLNIAQVSQSLLSLVNKLNLSLEEQIAYISLVLESTGIGLHVELVGQNPQGPCVSIKDRSKASQLMREPYDVVVELGLNHVDLALKPSENVLSEIRRKLFGFAEVLPLAQARHQSVAASAKARHDLLMEYCPNDALGSICYMSPILSEYLLPYGIAAGDWPGTDTHLVFNTAHDRDIDAYLRVDGSTQKCVGALDTEAQELNPELEKYVVLPRKSVDDNVDIDPHAPFLSATQIEVYLECPKKWFTQRRLGLSELDREFAARDSGTLVHAALEQFYKERIEAAYISAGGVQKTYPVSAPPKGIPADEEPLFIPGVKVKSDEIAQAKLRIREICLQLIAEQYGHKDNVLNDSVIIHNDKEAEILAHSIDDLELIFDQQEQILVGFEPRFTELNFGGREEGQIRVMYAGAEVNGAIDRIDVDAHNNALIIDYKYKGNLDKGYSAFAEVEQNLEAFELPHHIQTMMYAQIVKKLMPELNVVGAIYLGIKGKNIKRRSIQGILANEDIASRVGAFTSKQLEAIAVRDGIVFDDVLDICEEKVSDLVLEMKSGKIDAFPRFKQLSCQYCPVSQCSLRVEE